MLDDGQGKNIRYVYQEKWAGDEVVSASKQRTPRRLANASATANAVPLQNKKGTHLGGCVVDSTMRPGAHLGGVVPNEMPLIEHVGTHVGHAVLENEMSRINHLGGEVPSDAHLGGDADERERSHSVHLGGVNSLRLPRKQQGAAHVSRCVQGCAEGHDSQPGGAMTRETCNDPAVEANLWYGEPGFGGNPDARGRLNLPRLDDSGVVTGANKRKHRKENKTKRQARQAEQGVVDYWSHHKGQFSIPTPKAAPKKIKGSMCPSGLATRHPAAEHLLSYATGGCPVKTGNPWTRRMMEEAIAAGPHKSALEPDAMQQLADEVEAK